MPNWCRPIEAGNAATLQTLAQLEAAGHSAEQALALVNRMIDEQAFTMAATDIYYLSSLLFLALIGLVWLSAPRPASGVAAVGGAH